MYIIDSISWLLTRVVSSIFDFGLGVVYEINELLVRITLFVISTSEGYDILPEYVAPPVPEFNWTISSQTVAGLLLLLAWKGFQRSDMLIERVRVLRDQFDTQATIFEKVFGFNRELYRKINDQPLKGKRRGH